MFSTRLVRFLGLAVLSLAVLAPAARASVSLHKFSGTQQGSALAASADQPSVALPAIPANAKYVSNTGSDSGPGTQSAPWRTLAKATSSARPGDTVVFEPGTYGARGTRTNWTAAGRAGAPINFIGGPGTGVRPTILGYNVLYGSHVRVWNMFFDGPTGRVESRTSTNRKGEEVMLWLTAPNVQINDSEVSGGLWHAGIYVTNGAGDKIQGDYIHDNGDQSNSVQHNEDHGIYWENGSGGVIYDNLIVDNLSHGIQLYPAASRVSVSWNTIAGNGKSGVLLGDSASRNIVTNNIVAGNADNSIRSFRLTGAGNTVRNNIVWHNGSGNLGTSTSGLALAGNLQINPQFVGDGNYDLLPGSPAGGRAGCGASQ